MDYRGRWRLITKKNETDIKFDDDMIMFSFDYKSILIGNRQNLLGYN